MVFFFFELFDKLFHVLQIAIAAFFTLNPHIFYRLPKNPLYVCLHTKWISMYMPLQYTVSAYIYIYIYISIYMRVGTLIVATIYLQLIQNRYMFRSFTVLQCSHQHCVQPIASDLEVVGYL